MKWWWLALTALAWLFGAIFLVMKYSPWWLVKTFYLLLACVLFYLGVFVLYLVSASFMIRSIEAFNMKDVAWKYI